MDLLKAASREPVLGMLRAIEDKLYETGVLVSATGDAEADVTIAFGEIRTGAGATLALVVRVVTARPLDAGVRDWEPLRQYVVGKYAELQGALPRALRERLLDCPGPVLFVNGAAVG